MINGRGLKKTDTMAFSSSYCNTCGAANQEQAVQCSVSLTVVIPVGCMLWCGHRMGHALLSR